MRFVHFMHSRITRTYSRRHSANFDHRKRKTPRKMEMVLMPVADLRLMMIETASIAVRNNLPSTQVSLPADQIYNKPEAAKFLGIAQQTLDSYISEGKIPYCKPTGGKVYFLHSDLIDWLKKHRTVTAVELADEYQQQRSSRRKRATLISKAI